MWFSFFKLCIFNNICEAFTAFGIFTRETRKLEKLWILTIQPELLFGEYIFLNGVSYKITINLDCYKTRILENVFTVNIIPDLKRNFLF